MAPVCLSFYGGNSGGGGSSGRHGEYLPTFNSSLSSLQIEGIVITYVGKGKREMENGKWKMENGNGREGGVSYALSFLTMNGFFEIALMETPPGMPHQCKMGHHVRAHEVPISEVNGRPMFTHIETLMYS